MLSKPTQHQIIPEAELRDRVISSLDEILRKQGSETLFDLFWILMRNLEKTRSGSSRLDLHVEKALKELEEGKSSDDW